MAEMLLQREEDAARPFAQDGYDLMAACFEVHNVMGGGLLEEIYQECLEFELLARHIPFVSKQELSVYYKDRQLRKRYIPDLVVLKYLVVEFKGRAAAES